MIAQTVVYLTATGIKDREETKRHQGIFEICLSYQVNSKKRKQRNLLIISN